AVCVVLVVLLRGGGGGRVAVRVAVGTGVVLAVPVAVIVTVGVLVTAGVAVAVLVAVGVLVRVRVGVTVRVRVTVGVLVGVGDGWPTVTELVAWTLRSPAGTPLAATPVSPIAVTVLADATPKVSVASCWSKPVVPGAGQPWSAMLPVWVSPGLAGGRKGAVIVAVQPLFAAKSLKNAPMATSVGVRSVGS